MKAVLFICVFLFNVLPTLPALAQFTTIDSLENLLAKTPEDTNRVNLLNKLSVEYKDRSNDPEKAKIYAQQALALAQALNFPYGIGQAYNNLGNYHYLRNQNQDALHFYEKALQFFEESGRKRGLAVGYGNLGMIYEDTGNYPLAIEYYLKSLQIAQQIGEKEIQGHNLSSMGILLQDQRKYDEALSYNFQAIEAYKAAKSKISEGFVLNSIGNIYRELKQYDQSIAYLHQALHIFDSLHIFRGQAGCYNNLGLAYFVLHQYDSALAYHQRALEKSQPEGYTNSMIIAMKGIAQVYLQKERTTEAIDFLKKALQLAEQYHMVQNKWTTYESLAQAYRQIGDYQQAFEIQSKLVALKDSIFNDENDRKIAQLQANFEVEKKQAEIELLQKDNEQAALLRNAIAAGLLATLLIAGLIVSRQRLKIRKNQLLLQKSKEVAMKNKQLEEQALVLAQQAEALAQQTQKLQELDQVKSNFFANISHEFRTPLTLILGSLQDKLHQLHQSQQASLPVEGKEVKVMHRNARRLLDLINQLLDLSKLESGQLSVSPQQGDLAQFFRILAGSFSSLAEYRHINFELTLPERPLYFSYDADKLEKIVSNLLSNAFKFTPDGGQVALKVEIIPAVPIPLVQVTVQDSGPGIADEQLEKVFDRFYQGSKHYSDQQGTGIGLALVKELVQLHQGKVWATRDAVQGTHFIVQLPLEEVPPAHMQIDALLVDTPPIPATLSDHKVADDVPAATTQAIVAEDKPLLLIVEDNEDLRQYICKQLQTKYRIIESENGRQGVAAAIEQIPDLIISDLMMPDMDGFGLCQHIKTDERTSHIPVILLTALATAQSKLQGLETGADDYLTKPFDAQELEIRVRNLIENRKKLRERFSREVRVQPKDITVSSMDEKFLEKAMKIVEEHMGDADFGAEAFSREIAMSRMQLHRKLTALTGQTTSDFLRTMRLKRAARLLEARAGNISDVAFQVGFNSLPYFSKCFREHFGVSPNAYTSQQEDTTSI